MVRASICMVCFEKLPMVDSSISAYRVVSHVLPEHLELEKFLAKLAGWKAGVTLL